MDKIGIAIIGLGGRGQGLMVELFKMKDVQIVGVCDEYIDRAEKSRDTVKSKTSFLPTCTQNYKDLLTQKNVDVVLIATAWESHVLIATDSMKAGKFTAVEVGGAYCIQDCWDLIKAYEETKTPFMMLENCCYGRYEMMVMKMVKLGLLGTIITCEGGYMHDLRYEISHGKELRHYRLRNYISRNCENYPTHELGPIAQILNITRGNTFASLTSFSSLSKGLSEYVKENKSDNKELVNTTFNQGDIIKTFITCANGETITLTLDTTLPRCYSRNFTVRGTKGMYFEDNNSIFLDGVHQKFEFNPSRFIWNNAKKYAKKYDHPLWKDYSKRLIKGGHGGMDYLTLRAMIECARDKTPSPIDIYDCATWMAVTALSDESISNNNSKVDFPDFTKGAWKTRK